MDASVVICTFNRCGSLRMTLDGLEQMRIDPDTEWEVVVVDNNSTDATRSTVKEAGAGFPCKLRYAFEGKQGLSHARNRGIEVARGRILAFTDDDVAVDRCWLGNILSEFAEGEVACIGGKILPIWEEPPPFWLGGDLLNILALQDLGDRRIRLDAPVVWGANLSFRSSVFRKHGLFETGLGNTGGKLYGGEETKFVGQLLERGENVLYCPNVLVHHRIPGARLKKSYFRKWFYDKGELAAIQMGEYQARNLRGIPLYLIREAGEDLARYLGKQLASPRLAFREQLAAIHSFGMIAGRWKYRSVRMRPLKPSDAV